MERFWRCLSLCPEPALQHKATPLCNFAHLVHSKFYLTSMFRLHRENEEGRTLSCMKFNFYHRDTTMTRKKMFLNNKKRDNMKRHCRANTFSLTQSATVCRHISNRVTGVWVVESSTVGQVLTLITGMWMIRRSRRHLKTDLTLEGAERGSVTRTWPEANRGLPGHLLSSLFGFIGRLCRHRASFCAANSLLELLASH